MSEITYPGRHYETGTIANTLLAIGATNPDTTLPFSEAEILGASGGIAFGCFAFEYGGYLPHVALLTRNTFDPFNRALDCLGVRREVRESTNEAKGEENLRRELDMGNPALVWADVFSMPHMMARSEDMWAMTPILVLGFQDGCYQVVHNTDRPFPMTPEELNQARGRVKKDRYRLMVFEGINFNHENLKSEISNAVDLFLEKPPAGSVNNFGATGMRHWAKMLTDGKNAKGWPRKFAPGPKMVQALAGSFGQPGTWDWITTWGTRNGADRATYAEFLRNLGSTFVPAAVAFEESAELWGRLAEEALPDSFLECSSLKKLELEHQRIWRAEGRDSESRRMAIRSEMKALEGSLAESKPFAEAAGDIFGSLANLITNIAEIEERAFRMLKGIQR